MQISGTIEGIGSAAGFAVARVFKCGVFLRVWPKTRASKEASYHTKGACFHG
jgi:hypothetical protein